MNFNYILGPKCYCPPGKILSLDERTCNHFDMCSINPCGQFCRQEEGRIYCSCAKGFTLQNLTRCELNNEYRNGYIFVVANDNSIQRQTIFNETEFTEVISSSPEIKKISSLAFNKNDDLLYFVTNEDLRESHIYVYDNAASSVRSLYHGHGLRQVAYDWVSGNIYYAANGNFF